jgi:hypothetical protein
MVLFLNHAVTTVRFEHSYTSKIWLTLVSESILALFVGCYHFLVTVLAM